ncbi:MAG TPA: hypothetical protein VIG64_13490 [Actinomycetota bacterium]
MSPSLPEIRSTDAIRAFNGAVVTVRGTYRAIPRPKKGSSDMGRPNECAALELDDGTYVYLEPQDSAASARSPVELERFDGRAVVARGTIHAVMPSRGQSLINPCLADLDDIREAT